MWHHKNKQSEYNTTSVHFNGLQKQNSFVNFNGLQTKKPIFFKKIMDDKDTYDTKKNLLYFICAFVILKIFALNSKLQITNLYSEFCKLSKQHINWKKIKHSAHKTKHIF